MTSTSKCSSESLRLVRTAPPLNAKITWQLYNETFFILIGSRIVLHSPTLLCFSQIFSILSSSDNNKWCSGGGCGDSAIGHAALPRCDQAVCCLLPPSFSPHHLPRRAPALPQLNKTWGHAGHCAHWPTFTVWWRLWSCVWVFIFDSPFASLSSFSLIVLTPVTGPVLFICILSLLFHLL